MAQSSGNAFDRLVQFFSLTLNDQLANNGNRAHIFLFDRPALTIIQFNRYARALSQRVTFKKLGCCTLPIPFAPDNMQRFGNQLDLRKGLHGDTIPVVSSILILN